ncbi:carbohydrate porin [Vibrio alfacsensis]|uniref:carbohydrate porin n=1 Tax=Vibrio alfacsensis TaxID=1074311 RepID=UPI002ADE0DF9|nr:carbohydrate porin [Vibrio alfacsensis]WQE77692.1 carbohydrate porin [Vibrio alfacsensis]
MNNFKVLPLTLAVAASLASISSFAADTDVAALEKRIQELETRIETGYVYDQQPAVLTSETEVPLGIVFSGYARYGAHFQGSDAQTVGSAGALNANATGRLGNEGNGGEFQLAKAFKSDGGAIWDLVLMLDHWSDASWADDGGVNVKKMYAGAANLFESQPDLYVWAGRDFHQRPQTDLNDYFWMMHDGQGAGFYNLDLGGAKFDFGAVAQVEGDMVGDNGRYAITSKLHGIQLGESANLSLYANYGFTSDKVKDEDISSVNSYQLAGEASMAGQRLIVRYSDNAKDSVFDLAKDQTALLVSFDGSTTLTDKAGIQYLAAYQSLEVDGTDSRANYNVIVRPTYQWNDIHSTWIEGGYSVVDYDDFDATNSSWKMTLSQNMAIGPETWSRPMLRFYATVGNADNEYTGFDSVTGEKISSDVDTVTVGAMFEAWW